MSVDRLLHPANWQHAMWQRQRTHLTWQRKCDFCTKFISRSIKLSSNNGVFLSLLRRESKGVHFLWVRSSKLIQDHRKVTQTTLKYLLMVCNSIQFDWINKPTISLWPYKSPRRSRHVVTCGSPSVVFKQSKYKDIFFTSATSVHCRKLPGISFLLYLPEWVEEYISRFSCAKQIDNISSGEPFPWHRNSSPGCIKHEEKSECMHRWTR
jgi:hypothetical protein